MSGYRGPSPWAGEGEGGSPAHIDSEEYLLDGLLEAAGRAQGVPISEAERDRRYAQLAPALDPLPVKTHDRLSSLLDAARNVVELDVATRAIRLLAERVAA